MKTTTLLAALLTSTVLTAQAAGLVIDAPVTYTQPVVYAAGVTYLAPVTYTAAATTVQATMLERVVVTPSRNYTEHEWKVHTSAQRNVPQLWPVKATRSLELRNGRALRESNLLNSLLALN